MDKTVTTGHHRKLQMQNLEPFDILRRTWWILQIWSVLWLQQGLYWASRPNGHLAHRERGAPQTGWRQTESLVLRVKCSNQAIPCSWSVFHPLDIWLCHGSVPSVRQTVRPSGSRFLLQVAGMVWTATGQLAAISQSSCTRCCFYESADSGCSGADGDNCCRRSHPFPSLFILKVCSQSRFEDIFYFFLNICFINEGFVDWIRKLWG